MRTMLIAAAVTCSICACGTANVRRAIILLAPFEGRYREIGYEALYAAQLALADAESALDLLPMDDGGTPDLAVLRARAIAQLDHAAAVILLGHHAASADVQAALAPLPTWIVGWWGHEAAFPHVSAFFPQRIAALTGTSHAKRLPELARTPNLDAVGDVGGLLGFARLRSAAGLPLDTVLILSSGRLLDPQFAQRYLNSAPFAPPPRLIAAQVYDAVRLIARAASDGARLHELADQQSALPLYAYRLDERGELRLDHVIEQR
jgi:hypothetical protein